jgi:hypothetical protein
MLARGLDQLLKIRIFRDVHNFFKQAEARIQTARWAGRKWCLYAQPDILIAVTVIMVWPPDA